MPQLISTVDVMDFVFRRRGDTALEVFALGKQVAVLKRKRRRPN